MKKQLLVLPLASLLCFASCNKAGHELIKVDDATGIARAKSILAKEEAAIISGSWDGYFEVVPRKATITQNHASSEKTRYYDSIHDMIVEQSWSYNRDYKYEYNFDTLQFRLTSEYKGFPDGDDYLNGNEQDNFFYDENAKYVYLTHEELYQPYTEPIKTYSKTTANSIEEARAIFYELLNSVYPVFTLLLPTDYLTAITQNAPENEDKYALLEDYKEAQEYFNLHGDKNEHLNYQFGSNDENSVSLKTDLKVATTKNPLNPSDPTIYNGYLEGFAATTMDTSLNSIFGTDYLLDDTGLGTSVVGGYMPDLVVFKNNYLTYLSGAHVDNYGSLSPTATSIDVESAAQRGLPAGAYYNQSVNKSTIEVKDSASNITNPDLTGWEEQPWPIF